MPYSGAGDAKLPDHVKRKPLAKRRQWVAVFNRVHRETGDEGSSMAAANSATKVVGADDDAAADKAGRVLSARNQREIQDAMGRLRAVLKRAGVTDDEAEKMVSSVGAKCGMGAEVEVEYMPFGGATTFAELDEFEALNDQRNEINVLAWKFQTLVNNVLADDMVGLDEKARRIADLAGELEGRIAASPDGADGDKEGIASRVLRALGLKGYTPDAPAPAPAPVAAAAAAVVQPPDFVVRAAVAPGLLSITRDKATGRYRYVAVATNRYQDKEGEIFSAASHEEYVEWANRTKRLPELWIWHKKGSRLGVADAVAYDRDSGFRVSTGLFDLGREGAAEALAAMDGVAMSHGYSYDLKDLRDGVYHRYRTFEESVLPAKHAANAGTAFSATREDNMLNTEQRKFFAELLGEEEVGRMEKGLVDWSKDYAKAGVAFKALFQKDGVPAGDPPAGDPPPPAGDPAPGAAAAGDPAPPAGDPEPPVPAPGDPPPAGDGSEDQKAIVTAVKAVLEPLQTALDEMGTWRKGVDDALAELKQRREDSIASLIAPRRVDPSTLVGADAKDTALKGRAAKQAADIVADALKGGDGGDGYDDPNMQAAAPYVTLLQRSAAMPAMNGN